MQPSGKWIVEFADSACILSRRYGQKGEFIDFHMKAPMLGNAFEVVIVLPKAKLSSITTSGKGWIERPDGSKAADLNFSSYLTVDGSYMTRIYIDPEKYQIGEDGERITLQLGERRRYDFALTDLKQARTVLDQCLSGLRDDFGVGEAVTKQIVKPAKSKQPIVSYFSTDDYPSEAVVNGHQGYVGVLFWVETNGRVKDCKVIESSHHRSLDEQTCDVIVKRARFDPPLDANGTAIREPLYQRIRWEAWTF